MMKLSLLALAVGATLGTCFGASLEQTSPDELLLTEWQEFKTAHGKVYAEASEDDRRYQLYLATRYAVAKHNHEQALGLHSYRQDVNKLADIESSEFLGPAPQMNWNLNRIVKGASKMSLTYDPPASKDWRETGGITPVKDQGTKCNSGYAFATIAGLESINEIFRGRTNVSLSEQQIIDCCPNTKGCKGGDTYSAADYLFRTQGSEGGAYYPYTGMDGQCKFNFYNIEVPVLCWGHKGLPDESHMKAHVSNNPVQVGIYVPDSFKQYSHGVYSDADCSKAKNYHYVLAVGYAIDDKEGDYWIVKNSWGKNWGESGYARIARNKGNICDIASNRIDFC